MQGNVARVVDATFSANGKQRRKQKRAVRPFLIQPLEFNGGRGRNRTADTGIFNPLLYQLSYPAGNLATKAQPRGLLMLRGAAY